MPGRTSWSGFATSCCTRPDIVTAILAALDRIRFIIGSLAADGKEPDGDDEALIERLNAIAENRTPAPAAAPLPLPAALPEPAPLAAAAALPGLAALPEPAALPIAAARPAPGVPAAAAQAAPAADSPRPPTAEPPQMAADGGAAADAIAGQTIRVGVDVLER